MNLTAMQERLRQELLRRIQRGTLSVSLLARQTGFGESHISNFLRSRRKLSLEALDRVLMAQQIDVGDLLLGPGRGEGRSAGGGAGQLSDQLEYVPVVSAITAMYEPYMRSVAIVGVFHAPAGLLQAAQPRSTQQRRAWHRFVAVKVSETDAEAMYPLLLPNAVVLIDRHYTSLASNRPNRENLYAVRAGARMVIRYVDFQAERLVLRPKNDRARVLLLDLAPGESPGDLIVGRVLLVMNEL